MGEIGRFIKTILLSGLEYFGVYYSSYRGMVADNNDPLGLGRLILVIPMISGDQPYTCWAFQKGCYSGKGYGSQIIPSIGDVVWVEFERGSPKKPIWDFGYWGKEEKPTDTNLDKLTNYWFKTPKGILIECYDDNYVSIKYPNGPQFALTPKGISLVDKNGVFLGDYEKANEPAVLGDKNESALNDIASTLQTIAQALTQVGATDVATASNLGLSYAATLTTAGAQLTQAIIQLNQDIPKTKSSIVKLN